MTPLEEIFITWGTFATNVPLKIFSMMDGILSWRWLLGASCLVFKIEGQRDYSGDLQREVCHDCQHTLTVLYNSFFSKCIKETFGTKVANLEGEVMALGVASLGVGHWPCYFLTGWHGTCNLSMPQLSPYKMEVWPISEHHCKESVMIR